MNRDELLKTAADLRQVTKPVAVEYANKSGTIVSQMNLVMLERNDIKELVGEQNLDMMKDNHANHARFISSILAHFNAEVLVETVLWVFRAYRSRGFSTTYWSALLNTWVEVMKKELSDEAFTQVYPYYYWMLVNIPVFVKMTDDRILPVNN